MTAPYEIYSRLLFKEGQGYPLWNPALPAGCPKEYKSTGIQVGDVGYLTPDGAFIFLFNISLSKDHPINKWRGVPDDFVPVDLGPINVHYQSYPDFYPPKSVICYTEKGAKSIEGDVNATIPDLSGHSSVTVRASGGHQSSYSEAAALVLLNGASKNDYNCDLFGWAEKNVVHFYRYAITELGYNVPNGGLYLVTGVTNTDSWYISPFSEKSGGTYGSFEVAVKGVLSGGLSASTTSSVTGSYAPRYSPPNHKGQNQSVFIRGWKMMIQSGLFWKLKPKMINIHTATLPALRKVGPLPGSIHETPMSSTTRRGEPHGGETTEGTTTSSSTAGRREPHVGEVRAREGTTSNHNVSWSRTRRGEPLGEPLGGEPLGREPLGREPLGREPLGREPLGGETREETMSTNISSSTTRREPHGGERRERTVADKDKKPQKPSRKRRSQSPVPRGPAARKRDGPGGGAGGAGQSGGQGSGKRDGPGGGAGGAGQSGGQGSGKNALGGGGGGQTDRDETKDNEGKFNSGGGKRSVYGHHDGGWAEKENFSDDSEPGDSQADPMLHPYHPSDVVNKYLLQMRPQCEVALTHDDTWSSIFQEVNILDDEELLERINISYDIHESENKACVFTLRDGSETQSQSPKLEAVDSTIGHTSRDGFHPASQTLYTKEPGFEDNVAPHADVEAQGHPLPIRVADSHKLQSGAHSHRHISEALREEAQMARGTIVSGSSTTAGGETTIKNTATKRFTEKKHNSVVRKTWWAPKLSVSGPSPNTSPPIQVSGIFKNIITFAFLIASNIGIPWVKVVSESIIGIFQRLDTMDLVEAALGDLQNKIKAFLYIVVRNGWRNPDDELVKHFITQVQSIQLPGRYKDFHATRAITALLRGALDRAVQLFQTDLQLTLVDTTDEFTEWRASIENNTFDRNMIKKVLDQTYNAKGALKIRRKEK